MGGLRRAARRERGSSALEYLLVLSLVGLVVVALVGSGLRARSASAVQTAVCNLFSSEGCGADVAGGPAAGGPASDRSAGGGGGGGGSGDGGGGFWGGLQDAGGAFVDGLVRGDFNRDDRTDNGWTETSRGVGQFLSGVLIFGDVRDAGSAVEEIWTSGGRDGWGNLVLSGVGVIPIAGDVIKGVKGGVRVVDDVAGAADDVPRPRNPADDLPTCLTNSFSPATRVLLADGTTLPIAEVDVGDAVLASDPLTGTTGARAVTHLIVGLGVKQLVDVTVGGETLTATDGHPFYLPGSGEWVAGGDLRPGDTLRTAAGAEVEIEAVREHRTLGVVHNLTVADLHTYHVMAGDTPVLVHNQSGGPCFPSWGSGTGARTLPSGPPFDDPAVAREVNSVLDRVQGGQTHPYPQDGTVFRNDGRDGSDVLPARKRNYYREYTVPTPGAGNRGARRIIVGEQGEVYYSHEHYRDFTRIDPRRAP